MTEVPHPPEAGTHASSVVIDTNATVERSHLSVILSVFVALGLIAFTVVYFAVHDSPNGYTAGPAAKAVLKGLANAEIHVTFTGSELKCIDSTFAGFDLAVFDDPFDPFDGSGDTDTLTRAGTMFDHCLQKPGRRAVIAGSMMVDGFATAKQAKCAAAGFDDLVRKNGGYGPLFKNSDYSTLGADVFTVFGDCGVDASGGTGGTSVDNSPCTAEQFTIETAIEAYYAEYQVDATGYAQLVPNFLKADPSARFQFVPSVNGEIPTVHGIGECDGYGS
ncbi:MAG: hypothetical protein WCK21_10930 [Actinomycetota bacterium]